MNQQKEKAMSRAKSVCVWVFALAMSVDAMHVNAQEDGTAEKKASAEAVIDDVNFHSAVDAANLSRVLYLQDAKSGVYSFGQFSHADAVAKQSCTACHVSEDQTGQFRQFYFEEDFDADSNLDLFWANTVQPHHALELGKYQIRLLQDDVLRSHLKLEEGALLVLAGPGEGAPLQRGDVLLTVNEKPVKDPVQLRALLVEQRDSKENADVKLKVIRAGKPASLVVALAQLTPERAPFRIGVHLDTPSEALRSQLSLYENEGVIVLDVVEDSPASTAGIQKHDILLRAEGKRVSDREDLREVIQASEGEAIEIVLMRAAKEISVDVTPQRDKQEEQAQATCPMIGTWHLGANSNLYYGHPIQPQFQQWAVGKYLAPDKLPQAGGDVPEQDAGSEDKKDDTSGK